MNHYYMILGIPYGSNKEAIKKAFHKLAHVHHPDKGGDEAKFKQINEVYQVLMKQPDPQVRQNPQEQHQGFTPVYNGFRVRVVYRTFNQTDGSSWGFTSTGL